MDRGGRFAVGSEHLRLVLLAIAVGLLAGFGAVGVRALIAGFQYLFFGDPKNVLAAAERLNPLYRLLMPALGGLLVGPLIYYFAKEAKGHGVPEVMSAILLRAGSIRKRVAFIKALASSICIGSGGSVGREGPMVQIGSSLGSAVAQVARLEQTDRTTLVAAGAASGIAAAFNAPIAGTLFAAEIILGDFAISKFSPLVMAAVVATLVSHEFQGDFAAFQVPKYTLVSPVELIPYTLLGIVCGLVALAFIWFLYFCENAFERWKFPEIMKPAAGALVIGALGLGCPNIYGVGYESISAALSGRAAPGLLALLVLLKIFATSVTLGSGGSGGVFAPSLFLGAATGGVLGGIFHWLAPGLVATPGAYALVGMGGVVAGTTQAPITAILIIFEMTADYRIILPLMFSCIISSLITTTIKKESIYTQKLLFQGISLTEGKEEGILTRLRVTPAVNRECAVFRADEPVDHMIEIALASPQHDFPVVDGRDELVGIVRLDDLKSCFYEEEELAHLVVAQDIARPPAWVREDSSLKEAIDAVTGNRLDSVPVVRDGKVVGMVSSQSAMDLYNREVRKRELAAAIVQKTKFADPGAPFYVGGGYKLDEVAVPDNLLGKTLGECGFRDRFGLEVVLIKTRRGRGPSVLPTARRVLGKGDVLVLIGTIEDLSRLAQGVAASPPPPPSP